MKIQYITFLLIAAITAKAQTKEEVLQDIADREKQAVELVDQQLKAYNDRDIDAFVLPYSDDVEVYSFPDQLRYKGKQKMRESYEQSFEQLVERKAKIINRMVYGSQVIDHEEITGLPNGMTVHAVAIYVILGDKISKVYFLRQLR